MKICVAKKYLLKEMKLVEINKYLRPCLSANIIFSYCEETNKINISIDCLDWTNFFTIKKPCKYIFIFSFKTKKVGDGYI